MQELGGVLGDEPRFRAFLLLGDDFDARSLLEWVRALLEEDESNLHENERIWMLYEMALHMTVLHEHKRACSHARAGRR